jgi:hypothetical protein
MTISAIPGPIVVFPSDVLGLGPANQNPEGGPSPLLHFAALLDPRPVYTYKPGQDFGAITACWGGSDWLLVNQVPSAISAVNIVASYTPGAGTTLTLVTSSGAGITVGTSITNATTGATVTGLLAIDTATAFVAFGQSKTINAWDPTTMVSRNIRITSGGNDSGLTFTVNGYDVYGTPMTEAITGANAGIASGRKTFKYIASIVVTGGTVASTVSVGTGDVYGMPLRCDFFGLANINWNSTAITANTGFTAPDATSPATTTTGDVRGTYAVQAASDGTKRLLVSVMVPPNNLSTANPGLLGVQQT